MPSTYTASDKLEKIGVGEQPNTWGSSLNNDFDLVDQALDGVLEATLSTGSYNLNIANGTTSNGRNRVVVFSGTPGGPVAVSITPTNITKFYYVVNQTTQSVVLSNGAGATLTIAAGTTAPAFADGAGNVIGLQSGNNTFSSLTVTGNASIGGNETVGGDLSVTGITNLASTVNMPGGDDITIGTTSTTLHQYILSLIPASGAIVSSITNVSVSGGIYIVVIFGGTAGSRFAIAYGSGTGLTGTSIPVPTGFNTTNFTGSASLGVVSTSPGNQLNNLNVSVTGAVITATASDNSSNNYVVTAGWTAFCWISNA